MASARSVGRIILLALGVVLVGAFGLAMMLVLTAAGVCVALSGDGCPRDPTFTAIEADVELAEGAGAVLLIRGRRNPRLPDDYVAHPQLRVAGAEDAKLRSADASTSTFHVLIPQAPRPGATSSLSIVLAFGPRTGIEGCKERGHGQEYATHIDLTLTRSPTGELEVGDVRHDYAHYPGEF